jgi:cold shock CspA family protein
LRPAGTVVEFDGERGFGAVSSEDGHEPLFFHCTAIADGTRQIDVGARVSYLVVAGHQGRWEARDLQPA